MRVAALSRRLGGWRNNHWPCLLLCVWRQPAPRTGVFRESFIDSWRPKGPRQSPIPYLYSICRHLVAQHGGGNSRGHNLPCGSFSTGVAQPSASAIEVRRCRAGRPIQRQSVR